MIEYTYTVNDDNSVKIEWPNNEWIQKVHPTPGHVWTAEEAEAWALRYIQASKDNDNSIVNPGLVE
jgi:hypothetical protein